MMLKFGRIALVSTAALTLAAAIIPSKAEAFLYYPGGYGAVAYGGAGYYGGGCGCQVYVPPPPPPPPCCRVYGPQPLGYGGGYYGGGYGGGYGAYGGGGYGYNGGGYGGNYGY